jgi:hypothetical protein
MKMKNLILVLLAFCYLGLAPAAQADNLRLKNGTVVKGRVVSFANGSFTVALDLGTSSSSRAIIDMRDVESIEFENRSDDSRASGPRESTLPRPSAPDDDTGHRPSSSTTRPSNSLPSTLPPASTPAPSGSISGANAKEIVAVVPAKDDWTYANLVVRRGDRVQVNASGRVKISATRESGPEGVELDDKNKLITDRPTGALIAVIGDDNDDFIYLGREGEFTATRDGKLFLSVNEGDLTDNAGSFSVRVKVDASR